MTLFCVESGFCVVEQGDYPVPDPVMVFCCGKGVTGTYLPDFVEKPWQVGVL